MTCKTIREMTAKSNPVTGSYSCKAVTWRKEARTLKAWHPQNPTFIAWFEWLQSEIVQGAVELERDNQEKLQKKVQDLAPDRQRYY